MTALLKIFFYIVKNNPWYSWGQRFIQAAYYQLLKRWSGTIYSKRLFNGKSIFLFPRNPISSAFIYAPFPDQKEILLLRQLADKQTVFIDIGANIGAYSILLADKVKEIYAFEAHPVTADYCKMNFLLNHLPETHVIAMALSNRCEEKYFSNYIDASPTNSLVAANENAIKVLATTLDTFAAQQEFPLAANFLIKIDVEGFELEVLQGAENFLKKHFIKGILFETFSEGSTPVMTWLQAIGFKTRYLGNNNMLAYREAN